MKYIIAPFLWLIGGTLFLLLFLLVYALMPFVKSRFLHNFFCTGVKIILSIIFIKPKIIYEEQIDKSKTYVFMPNHVSMMDVIIASGFWPVYINGIEAHTHFNWYFYGPLVRAMEEIPINRTSVKESLKSFEIAKERLKTNRSIVLYPEGTRSKDGNLNEFKKLPFRFAKNAGVDIIPVAFIGIESVTPEKSIWILPKNLKIIFAPNITEDELLEKVKSEIIRMKEKYK
jgi:1-acyl-sn-glycerol-3-phosphate acyltransferase